VVESHWSEISFDSDWLANRTRIRAKQILLNLAEYLATAAGRLIESEQKVVAEIGDLRVLGRIDRVEIMADDSVQVADIKTGSPPTASEAANSRQLQLYQLALANRLEGRSLSGAKIVALAGDDFKVFPQPALSGEVISELHELAADFKEALAQPTLTASVASHCHTDPTGCGWLLGGKID
jgi:RecB family exonuclease